VDMIARRIIILIVGIKRHQASVSHQSFPFNVTSVFRSALKYGQHVSSTPKSAINGEALLYN
jgi:hypothetical protein